MPYTIEDARVEVGDSKDWPVGLEASIKKYEQRVAGNTGSYRKNQDCGLCIVADNRRLLRFSCPGCPCPGCPCTICKRLDVLNDEEILHYLENLREEVRTDGPNQDL